MTTSTATDKDVTEVEKIKAASRYLRGTITDGLADPITGSIAESDTQLTKFHGIYQQDDRDYRNERRKQKLEPYYVFMIRVAVPGGICSPHQWLELDRLSRTYADGTLRLTTRQSFQLHHVLKRHLKYSIREINETLLTTLSACGDVNRNVMCSPNPYQSPVHRQVYAVSKEVSEHLKPRTSAYHEIWLNGELVESRQDDEPIYGRTYLPRKFKIAFAIPPRNDVDVFAHDLGFIAVVKDDRLLGFNVSTGGGMGMTHNVVETYPRLADVIGFCSTGQVIEVAENVVKIQRDNGDRTDRKHARFKYTIDDRGTDWLKAELNNRLGWQLQPARPYQFESMGDRYGWLEGTNGNWFLTLFIQNGRVADTPDYPMMTGIREIAKIHDGDFRLTPNQNLMIGDILPRNRTKIKKLLRKYKLHDTDHQTGLRLNSMACVAFPTCGLAMAESERCLPGLLARLDNVMNEAGLHDDPIVVRMSGCPNGCSRPYNAEIAFVGKAPNNYNMYMGASFTGNRLSKLYRESLSEDRIVEELTPIIHRYAAERHDGERFGDFVIRTGYVTAVTEGKHFHD